ncbi:ATP1B4 [Pelobates cultripes]|uniref:Sodium/potassium-transporting ATPase subunit beta n=1 Tax=Pelobates cultripes TaxID=61616 RepID=A0AAD1T0N3_PELCU|nr:ATP1B4 [Pelobates cultripes]
MLKKPTLTKRSDHIQFLQDLCGNRQCNTQLLFDMLGFNKIKIDSVFKLIASMRLSVSDRHMLLDLHTPARSPSSKKSRFCISEKYTIQGSAKIMEMDSSTPRLSNQREDFIGPLRQASLKRRHYSIDASEMRDIEETKTWKERIQDFKRFIWNPYKGEFMGRDKKSWAKILFFYFCLYVFLTGMFALCIYGLLLTINPYVPTYRDRVFPPGLTIRPHITGHNYAFNGSERSTWSSFTDNLDKFLEDYEDDTQIINNIECTPGQYFVQPGDEKDEKKACQFRRSQLKNCSGIDDPSYGFAEGKPCFILKMNRVMLNNDADVKFSKKKKQLVQ